MSHNIVWIIGAGNMAKEYAKILLELNVEFSTIGRGEKSAQNFESEIGTKVITGGIQKYLQQTNFRPNYAIVCVNDEELSKTTSFLLENNIVNILVEKPAGLSMEEISEVVKKSHERKANVFVAYNRRFYSSVIKAREIIKEDGGIRSFNFEFTEWSHVIVTLGKSKRVLENWLLANSSHVIDMAFFLGGKPKEMTSFVSGGLSWHPSASIYSGAGITENGILFSYQANWEAPGRWGVEVLTRKHRLIFRPLEKLSIQEIGSVEIKDFPIPDELDKKFKPGLFLQVKKFLEGDTELFCSIEQQYNNISFYKKIGHSL